MAVFEVERDGKRYEIEAPSMEAALSAFDVSPPTPESDPERGFLPFANQALINTLDLPGQILYGGMEALGLPAPSREQYSIAAPVSRSFEAIGGHLPGVEAQPETLLEHMGQGVGGAAGAIPVGGGIVSALARSAGPVARGLSQTLARPFIETPKRAIAAELGAGAGAGAGTAAAENLYSENPISSIAGALLGGLAGGMGPAAAVRLAQNFPATRFLAGEIAPFTDAGARQRAGRRVRSMSEDPELARQRLAEETISDLSPAVRTGDPRLMQLEQLVRSQNAPADRAMRLDETTASTQLRAAMDEIRGGTTTQQAREFLSGRVQAIIKQTEDRTAEAMERARKKVEQLEPQNRQAQSSVIFREELDAAHKAARAQERELWDAVPEDMHVPTSIMRETYQNILAETARAQRDDIPAKARRFLDADTNERFGDTESIKEVHGLYSALREEARNARAAGEMNRARIADRIADGVMADLEDAQIPDNAFRNALDYSRRINEIYRRGSIGRLLSYERDGGGSVPPEMALPSTVGRGGIAGAVSIDEINRAIPSRGRAVEDYILGRAVDFSVRGGELSPSRAETFLRQNAEMLERTPDVRAQIVDALAATEAARRTSSRMDEIANALSNSAAARFSGAREGAELQAILRSSAPVETARQVTRQARGMVGGVKGALLDDLIRGATTPDFDDAGAPLLSGRNMVSRLRDPKVRAVAAEILSPDELSRMDRIADELGRLETMRRTSGGGGDIMGDEPNSIIAYMARVAAARMGAQAGAGTSGASLQTAQMASTRMKRLLDRLTNDKAEDLIIRAVTGDKDLFDALLAPMGTMTKQQETRMIEALTGIAGQTAVILRKIEDTPMPRGPDGNYNLPPDVIVSEGQTILPSQHNPALQDIASALTNSLDRNGRGSMLAALDMGGYKVFNLLDGVASGDAVNKGQMYAAVIAGPHVAAGYSNLRIDVTGNATVDVDVDFLTVFDSSGNGRGLRNVDLTINLGNSGANGLDTGSEAASTWYAVHVIFNPTTDTVAGLLSTSATSPTLPSGYTFARRVGWVRNDGTSNLFRTIQRNARATYVVGTNPANPRQMMKGSAGSPVSGTYVAVSVAPFVPPGAVSIFVYGVALSNTTALIAAPNNSYGGRAQNTNPPPLDLLQHGGYGGSVEMMLESGDIYYASGGAENALFCSGWTDAL